jgi:hypothetical protein
MDYYQFVENNVLDLRGVNISNDVINQMIKQLKESKTTINMIKILVVKRNTHIDLNNVYEAFPNIKETIYL